MQRGAGILLPIFELPSKYGVGSLGKWAYAFVDFLKKSAQKYWQILPLAQTGYGDSPYQSVCDYSGNPYFIDLETLRAKRLLTYREVEGAIEKGSTVDYGKLFVTRYALLWKAFNRFDTSDRNFRAFVKKGDFKDYALFMSLSNRFKKPWCDWPAEFRDRNEDALNKYYFENKTEMLYWQFLQYEFRLQYDALKKYANKNGVNIIGDLPLYVAYDSVDVWANSKEFLLGENYKPKKIAGVPPDYFSEEGQMWGNPVYDYEYQKSNGFAFWKRRMEIAKSKFDIVRVDHFRGLAAFWAIDDGKATAKYGEWMTAPGDEILSAIGADGILAEDLGLVDEDVKTLLDKYDLPGMKVLSFALDGDEENPYLPWNITENSVTYTGTHDNDTLVGYFKSLTKEQFEEHKKIIRECLDYLKIYKSVTGIQSTCDAMIDIAFAVKSDITIVPMHDHLLLDGSYRINNPGHVGYWVARIKESVFTDTLAQAIKRRTKRFDR